MSKASMNKVLLLGNLGADPDMKYTAAGTAVCNFSMATTKTFKDKAGAKQEKTAWHRCVSWGKLAEICGKYLKKGSQVLIEGSIDYGSYEKDGHTVYTTTIIADQLTMLGSPGGTTSDRPGPAPAGGPDDDIPF